MDVWYFVRIILAIISNISVVCCICSIRARDSDSVRSAAACTVRMLDEIAVNDPETSTELDAVLELSGDEDE